MTTFNGEAFIGEQIESLLAQTDTDWILMIRDDGSTDRTLELVHAYAAADDRIEIIEDEQGRTGSSCSNFSLLLQAALGRGADYVLCCDQDDVWDARKVAIQREQLACIETSERLPTLVHHDLEVVDEQLRPVADSYSGLMRIAPGDEQNPQRLLSRNEVTGCTLACNRSLLEMALPIPNSAIMHDWWLALCAAYFGRLRGFPDRLVRYRQHPANVIGASSFWHGLNPFTYRITNWQRGNGEFLQTIEQAKAFMVAFEEKLDYQSADCKALDRYCSLAQQSPWGRLQTIQENNLWRRYWFSNFVLFLRLLLLPRK